MIIMIILMALFGISIGLLLLFMFLNRKSWYETQIAFCGACGALFTLALIVCSVFCLVNNNSANVETAKYDLSQKVELLKNERYIIDSFHAINDGKSTTFTSDITLEVITTADYYKMVNEYNLKVYDFKTSINTQKVYRKNVWFSWFVNPACLSISDETLNNLSFTIGR